MQISTKVSGPAGAGPPDPGETGPQRPGPQSPGPQKGRPHPRGRPFCGHTVRAWPSWRRTPAGRGWWGSGTAARP
ncbi:hypothetical protein CA984_02720 [Streptosporangium minutum]|uniref:Uncharacterized protein n=1 Tax=Streptosporangium minutum TaxID=569862 RepID=A0A243RWS7_9ACTN|nr:hypothetical protein CA984_02720 [Streptosporangium minutum]